MLDWGNLHLTRGIAGGRSDLKIYRAAAAWHPPSNPRLPTDHRRRLKPPSGAGESATGFTTWRSTLPGSGS